MTAQPTPPKRRLQLTLTMGADDLKELVYSLMSLATDLDLNECEQWERTSGGVASGHHLNLTCDPDMTADLYQTELEAWIKAAHEGTT